MKARFCGSEAHGFTLVELMVAMLGGLFISVAVFSIAKQSSNFTMSQSRVSDATLQSVVGFERLRADLSRAGYLSTPNMVADPKADCNRPTSPLGLARLASIYIEPVPGAQLSAEITALFSPQRLVLAGSYTAGNEFQVATIEPGPPVQVVLQENRLGLAEMGYADAPTTTTLSRVFQTGRALRLTDKDGQVQYAEIAGTSIAGGRPAITLAANPALLLVGPCGIKGHATGVVASVVNIIRYDMRDLRTMPQYAAMFSSGAPNDTGRRELVREELDLTGAAYADSLELISEYAVDLGFSLFVREGDALVTVDPGAVTSYAGDPSTLGAGRGPQRIRAVRFWLSNRSQELSQVASSLYVPAVPGPSVLTMGGARVRTLQSTIALNNQAGVTW
ncbi:MAG: hypothetical protein RL685_5961 [Pseudomonadota bacterium]|jgi:hypothetical protein